MPDAFEAVLYSYLDRRIAIIPVPFGRKRPVIEGWPTLKVTRANLSLYFPTSEKWNVGFLCGDASGGLVDVDLDCPEAIAVAPYILQTDTSIFGRASKRSSHWLYYSKISKGRIQHFDPKMGNVKSAMIVELRGSGHQTVLPGSMHESGEPITWEKLDEIAAIDGDVLEYQVSLVAAASLLARYAPGQGARHHFYLVLGGLLARCGFERHKAELLAQAIVAATNDEERKDRVQAVADAGDAHKRGKHTFGLTELKNIVGQEIGARIAVLLGYHEPLPIIDQLPSDPLEATAYEANGHAPLLLPAPPVRVLKVTSAAIIVPRAIRWIWPQRFAVGKLGILAGMPDRGKGLIGCDITARISTGAEWPCSEGNAPLGSVIVLSAEDDAADTIVPRLMAANADLNKVHLVEMERTKLIGNDVPVFSLLTDLALLEALIVSIGDVKMVWIDPVSAYMGVGKANTFKQSDVRGVLTPLREMADKLGVFVLGILHFNKNEGTQSAMLRVSDSIAYTAAARHTYCVVDQPESDMKLFAKVKNNLAPGKIKGIEYGIGSTDVDQDRETAEFIKAPFVIWGNYSETSADEGLASSSGGSGRGRPSAERDDAKDWLRDVLYEGPMPSKWVINAGLQQGHTKHTIIRASQDLNVVKRPTKSRGEWTWQLPEVPSRGETDDE